MKLLRSTACVGVLGLLAALGGCYDMTSEAPVITQASRIAQTPLASGRYCNVDVQFDDAGAPAATDVSDDCFAVAIDGATLTLTVDDPSEAPLVMEVADLGRGASLLQFHDAEVDKYRLLYAFLRADAVVALDEPPMTAPVVAAAESAGVVLSYPYEEAVDREIEIVGGPSDAALGFLRDAAGLMFDAALRDPEMAYALKDDAVYYVRVGGDAASADLDAAAALGKVGVLVEAIERAMALE